MRHFAPGRSTRQNCASRPNRRKFVWGRSLLAAALSTAGLLLAAGPAMAQTFSLAWDRNADSYTRGYVVFGGVQPGVYIWSADVGPATSATLPALPQNGSYYFTVRGYNAGGELGPAAVEVTLDFVVPNAPTGVTATAVGSRVTLAWNGPTSGAAATQYLISVGTSPGASNLVNGLPVGSQLSVSGDVAPGRYYARVNAANTAGVGPASPEISFVVGGPDQPGNPSGLTVSWQGSVATLRWNPGTAAAAYVIEAGTAPGANNIGTIPVSGATQYSVDVPPGTYYVRVRSANGGLVSGPSNEVVVSRTAAVPAAPTTLASFSRTSGVDFAWRAPASGPPPTGYLLEAGSAPGLSNLAVLRLGTQTTYTAAAPPAGVYYVRVRAVNANGVSPASNETVVRR